MSYYFIENNIIKTEPVNFDFAELGGLGSILFKCMKKYAKNIAQIDPETGRQDTYEYTLRNVVRTAITMKQKGIKKGDIVMSSIDNQLDACIPIFAALFLGALPCSMNPNLTRLEVEHLINQVKPKLIFSIPSCLDLIKEVCQKLEVHAEMVVFGTSSEYTGFQTFIEEQPGEDEFQPIASTDPKETAVIYFSSGTSSLAKACCLSHAYFIRQSILVPVKIADEDLDVERRNLEFGKIELGLRLLSYSPLYWMTGAKIFFDCMVTGSTRVLGKDFDAEEFWSIVDKYEISLAMVSPFAIPELKRHGKPKANIDSLLKIFTGGASLQSRDCKLLQEMLMPNEVDIVQSYGLTETGVVIGYEMFSKKHRECYRTHPECLGYPLRGIWYKVVDPDTNQVLGPNQEGELLVKSEFLSNGYYKQPCHELFDSEGWFRTGDVIYYTDDCAFYHTDRLKELLKYRQLTVFPYVVEKELLEHPAVAQAVVLGIPHEEDGDHPAAFVVLNPNCGNVTPEEIRDFVDAKVQDKAKLRGGVRIVESIPISVTGKISRRELRRMIMEEKN